MRAPVWSLEIIEPIQEVSKPYHSGDRREAMSQQTISVPKKRPSGWPTAILLILPFTLLGGIIVLFLNTGDGLDLAAPVPTEALVERIILKPSAIDVTMRNSRRNEATIAQIAIDEVIWSFSRPPEINIPRLGEATIHLDYEWSASEPNGRTFWSFTLIGIYVGIIPIYLGVLWLPALRQLSQSWMVFLLAVTAGLLLFLGVDTLAQVLKRVEDVPGPFDGVGLVDIGAVSIFLLLKMISKSQMSGGRSETSQGLKLAYLIATGIGLHNLGEGLAVGTAYDLGEISLGALLIAGFIIQNTAKGVESLLPF
jgi:zinc transporter, ZIP family